MYTVVALMYNIDSLKPTRLTEKAKQVGVSEAIQTTGFLSLLLKMTLVDSSSARPTKASHMQTGRVVQLA